MNVLDRLVVELRATHGPMRSTELASIIGVSEPALDGMISVLAAKGVLTTPDDHAGGDSIACSGVACATTCVGLDECPFIANIPTTYSLVIESQQPTVV